MKAQPLREHCGEHLSQALARARPDETLATIAGRLGKQAAEVELVCAVGPRDELLGALPLRELFTHPPHTRLDHAMRRDFPVARLHDDQERAASLALHHGVDALPVVDEHDKLRGVMPAQALLHILRREHVEDLHRLAGIQRETSRARHAIEDPPLRRVQHRLPWLVVGLAGSAAATALMAGFEARLAANVAIAFFIPAIVYLADAVGTQTEAIAVRGLSLTRAGLGPLLAAELGVGTLIGAALGALALAPIYLAFGDAALAFAVGTSIWVASSLAATMGLLFPWLLARIGLDPAHGSGPVATVVQDILSILSYFVVLRLYGV